MNITLKGDEIEDRLLVCDAAVDLTLSSPWLERLTFWVGTPLRSKRALAQADIATTWSTSVTSERKAA
jgi:hypothetical protein